MAAKSQIIFEWLTRIGLAHAIPMFQAEGITSPPALIALKMEDYESLGVTDADDRRRLLELVHRVREVRWAMGSCSCFWVHRRPVRHFHAASRLPQLAIAACAGR